ncbi:hypothetical protein [Microvirga yunnanensis]|uniref:hypothetical protein n=1 Tax=Microvirga yunnanensis TaxID=2953740 RepID=UPI0021C6F27B|nr:hypothetical protein [Microvirga sp. HBU65207]
MNLRPFLGLILDRSTGTISVEAFAVDLEADEWILLLLRSDDTWDGRKAWADDLLAWAIPLGGMRTPIDIPIVYEAPDGSDSLTPCDPEVGRQIALAEEIMHEDHDILQALAK